MAVKIQGAGRLILVVAHRSSLRQAAGKQAVVSHAAPATSSQASSKLSACASTSLFDYLDAR
jgi:hypothetical protein